MCECVIVCVCARSGCAELPAMPFIEDDLLWCPDNDGRMVDLSSCLQVISTRRGMRHESCG